MSAWTIYRRLAWHARPYWPHVVGILALNLLAVPLKLLTPLPLKLAVDNVLGGEPFPYLLNQLSTLSVAGDGHAALLFVAVLLVMITVLAYLNSLGIWLLASSTGHKLVARFRAELFRHVQGLSLSFHDRNGAAASTYRIQYDAPSIQWIALEGVIPFVTAGITVVAMVFVIASLNIQLALVALAVIPPLLLLTRTWGRRLRNEWRAVKRVQSSAMSVVQETLGGLRVVKAFGTEDRQHDRFKTISTQGIAGQVKVATSQGTYELLAGVILALGGAATLYIGIRNVRAGQLLLGDFLLIWAYLAQLYGPLQTVSNKLTTLQDSLASAERVLALLDENPAVVDNPHALPVARCRGEVQFQDVSFAYPGSGGAVLHHVSFAVQPGARVGIVGPTGAGKSTLINLLVRFYDPSSGCVALDGVDLRDYRLDDLRGQFAIVLQEPLLFSASIAENIAYARPEASQAEIVAAATAANAHEFVSRLPEGYQTQVGDRGAQLSGGERQRIALARAFLKNAPLLILDEPTSSVDLASEVSIVEAIRRLIEGRTTFVIAHRPDTLKFCDRFLRIEDGRLVSAKADHSTAVT